MKRNQKTKKQYKEQKFNVTTLEVPKNTSALNDIARYNLGPIRNMKDKLSLKAKESILMLVQYYYSKFDHCDHFSVKCLIKARNLLGLINYELNF